MILTDAQITAAARALANENADTCNVNREDNWMIYGDSFRESAKIALEAAQAAPQSPAAISDARLVEEGGLSDELRGEIESIIADSGSPGPELERGTWCCVACGNWTPHNHPEAHSHEDGCPALAEWNRKRDWRARLRAILAATPSPTATVDAEPVARRGLTRHQCNAIEYFVTQMRDEPTAVYVDMFDAFRDYINSLVEAAPTLSAPADGGALTDEQIDERIKVAEQATGIYWFVPDDSERHLWRTINTDQQRKFARALLASPVRDFSAIALTDDEILDEYSRHVRVAYLGGVNALSPMEPEGFVKAVRALLASNSATASDKEGA